MQNVLDTLSNIMDAFGASIVVPVVLFIICLFMRLPVKKAFQSALNAGIGLIGFNLLIGAYTPIVTPTVERMVETTGINLNILDTGWQATSVVAYSTEVGMIFLGLGIILQTLLFVTKYTNIFMPSDLWNNYSFMLWGSMLFIATGNLWLAILLMVVTNLYTLVFAELLSKRWSTYYGYPRTTIVASHDVGALPLGLAMDWILTKLGANKVRWSPENLQNKLGFLGEATTLGLVIGLILGLVGNFTNLNTLEGWGEATMVGVATAAIMAIFPRIAGIFASAFTSITDASKKTAKSSGGKGRVWYLGINDAAGYGESATLLTGMLLIPTIIILSVVLPGNQALPMVDLIAIPYMLQAIVPLSNGNILKAFISGAVYLSIGLYLVTAVAPIFTEVATSVGVSLPAGAVMIFSLAVMTNHLAGLLFLLFLTQNPVWIILSIAVYVVLYIVVRLKKEAIQTYMERQALGDEFKEQKAINS